MRPRSDSIASTTVSSNRPTTRDAPASRPGAFLRPLVILLAFGMAVYRLSQGATVPAAGLGGLGAGLLCLQLAKTRSHLRWAAWAFFGVTAAACVVQYLGMRVQ